MFQFTGLPSVPYVFRYGYRRITSGEFPHSEIPGSQNGQLLPRAYRSRPRPSSALSAKASTVCPCSLDQKNTGYRCRYGVFKVHAGSSAQSFKTQQRTSLYRNGTVVEIDVYSRRAGCPDGTDVKPAALTLSQHCHQRFRRLPE